MPPGYGFGAGFGPGARGAGGAAPFDPGTLFGGSRKGGWYDPNDLATVWQDTAGTVPGAVGSPVARIDAADGTFTPMLQATGAKQPILRLNATTGYHYLDVDKEDDGIASVPQPAPGGTTGTMIAGVRARGPAHSPNILAFGGTTSTGSINIAALASNVTWTPATFARSSTGAAASMAAGSDLLPAPVAAVLTSDVDFATDRCILRVNGVQVASSTTDQGAGGFTVSRALGVGPSFNDSLNADWYGGLAVWPGLTAEDIEAVEAMFTARMG